MNDSEALESNVKVRVRRDPDRRPSERPRLVIRFRLADSKDNWIKRKIWMLADRLEHGTLAEHEAKAVAQALRGIAAGFSADDIFHLGNTRGGQSRVRRDKWMTIDYRLRRRLKHNKVSAHVAYDWRQAKPRTVEDIQRRHRSAAEKQIDKWVEMHPLELYLDAVADVRNQLLTGTGPEVTKDPDETIQIELDLEEALMMFPPELQPKNPE